MEHVSKSQTALHEVVADRIRDAILKRKLHPGERLVEDRLAEQFDVSRHPIREALRTLQLEGFVEISPRRGATVTLVSPQEGGEMFEVLAALTGVAARLASEFCSDETAAGIAAVLAEAATILDTDIAISTTPNLERLAQLNDEFHRLVARASGNRQLIDTMTRLRDRIQWIRATVAIRRPEASWREHQKIFDAIGNGRGDVAEKLARSHVDTARKLYLEQTSARKSTPT